MSNLPMSVCGSGATPDDRPTVRQVLAACAGKTKPAAKGGGWMVRCSCDRGQRWSLTVSPRDEHAPASLACKSCKRSACEIAASLGLWWPAEAAPLPVQLDGSGWASPAAVVATEAVPAEPIAPPDEDALPPELTPTGQTPPVSEWDWPDKDKCQSLDRKFYKRRNDPLVCEPTAEDDGGGDDWVCDDDEDGLNELDEHRRSSAEPWPYALIEHTCKLWGCPECLKYRRLLAVRRLTHLFYREDRWARSKAIEEAKATGAIVDVDGIQAELFAAVLPESKLGAVKRRCKEKGCEGRWMTIHPAQNSPVLFLSGLPLCGPKTRYKFHTVIRRSFRKLAAEYIYRIDGPDLPSHFRPIAYGDAWRPLKPKPKYRVLGPCPASFSDATETMESSRVLEFTVTGRGLSTTNFAGADLIEYEVHEEEGTAVKLLGNAIPLGPPGDVDAVLREGVALLRLPETQA